MTKLEQKYRKNIGKLFVHPHREWGGAKTGWVWIKNLVMINDVERHGGWFHYSMDVVKNNLDNVDGVNDRNRILVSCKEFHRKAVDPLSLLGDTENKEVA